MEKLKRVSSESPEAEWEKKIQSLLETAKLPEEIVERWEDEYGERPRSEQYAALQQRVERRREALRGNAEHMASPIGVEVTGESPLAIQQMVERLDAGSHEKLGEGLSARVIASARNVGQCYKVFFPPERQPSGTNDIAVEAELQDAVSKLGPVAGVHVPSVRFFVKNKTVRAIAMERIDGVSIKDVLERGAALPPSFDAARFFSSLRSFLNAMHERGYYHRDLHGGNVLIDNETGMPWVIDFGHGTHTISDEGVYQEEIVETGRKKVIVLLSDEEAPKLLEKKLTAYIADRQETS